MDRLDSLRAFIVAVDHGSLSAAARALSRSPASVTRAIASVEQRLGTTLLRRTTRSLRLTEAGERYLVVARRVLADLDDAEKSAGAAAAQPQGLLTVTAPTSFGSLHVRPLVDEYLAANPRVRARLLLLDRVVSVVEEGIDVAVRIGHLADSALMATTVGSVRRVVVASPAYLARHGRPTSAAALAEHRCVVCTAVTPNDTWTFGARREGERAKQVRVTPVLSVNLPEAAIGATKNGVGVTCVVSYQVAESVRSGALVVLLAELEPPPVPVHLVYPATSARTAKVRAFVELATPRLRATLAEKTGRPRAR
ncbi:LysR family transcriptional regulator [Myxococcus eversor]|uniref:LysR family transcriptional regulator n=1 Tax=Myxococcus eversor TaxID=2709661 RepID=UPI0013D82F2E|nr:LysR family transcriptional regulator [Myxococcus eversor]